MPQASDEQRAEMDAFFNNGGVDDSAPLQYLLDKGWGDGAGMLRRPTLDYEPTEKEWKCVDFLIDEWDYGYTPN